MRLVGGLVEAVQQSSLWIKDSAATVHEIFEMEEAHQNELGAADEQYIELNMQDMFSPRSFERVVSRTEPSVVHDDTPLAVKMVHAHQRHGLELSQKIGEAVTLTAQRRGFMRGFRNPPRGFNCAAEAQTDTPERTSSASSFEPSRAVLPTSTSGTRLGSREPPPSISTNALRMEEITAGTQGPASQRTPKRSILRRVTPSFGTSPRSQPSREVTRNGTPPTSEHAATDGSCKSNLADRGGANPSPTRVNRLPRGFNAPLSPPKTPVERKALHELRDTATLVHTMEHTLELHAAGDHLAASPAAISMAGAEMTKRASRGRLAPVAV